MALAREEERGGREKEGTPWPPRSGGGRRPEREAERERDPHVDEGRHKGCTEKQATDVGSHQMANRTAANKRMTWTASLCAVGRNFHL